MDIYRPLIYGKTKKNQRGARTGKSAGGYGRGVTSPRSSTVPCGRGVNF